MKGAHVISDELFEEIIFETGKGNNWIAYNTIAYFLDDKDVYFFNTRDEANQFTCDNISEYDNYRVVYARSIDEFLKQIPYNENLSIMNEKNFEYLKDNLKYHGFSDTLNNELESSLKKGQAEFTLAFKTEVNKRNIEATLYFKKSDTTDMYFFNRYDSRLKNEKDETMAQTFYINKGQGVTLKEAYNLLNGRAVHKELTDKNDQKYQAWIQLDFSSKDKNGNFERKQFHENYGYDLKEALSYYPIKEMMKEDDLKSLVRSLEKGNVQMVTLETQGKDTKVYIEANPQYKTINVYNNRMQRLDQDKREELMKKPELNNEKEKGKDKDQVKDKEQSKGMDGAGEEKKSKGRKSSMNGEDSGLVTKKRTNGNKKGLGV